VREEHTTVPERATPPFVSLLRALHADNEMSGVIDFTKNSSEYTDTTFFIEDIFDHFMSTTPTDFGLAV
jgi:hypothetical protein